MQMSLFDEMNELKAPRRPKRAAAKPRSQRPKGPPPASGDLFDRPMGEAAARGAGETAPPSKAVATVRTNGALVPQKVTIDTCLATLGTTVRMQNGVTFVEPGAGEGSFLPQILADSFGQDPELGAAIHVVVADFCNWQPEGQTGPIVVIGCPPNGRNGATALQHINHAASFADYTGFILSDAFAKPSRIRRIDARLHIIADVPLPADAFEGKAGASTPRARFMIFERRDVLRVDPKPVRDHPDFDFVGFGADPTFAIRRVGAHAGKISDFPTPPSPWPRNGFAPTSNYFIRLKAENADEARAAFDRASESIRARMRERSVYGSLSKAELVESYEEARKME